MKRFKIFLNATTNFNKAMLFFYIPFSWKSLLLISNTKLPIYYSEKYLFTFSSTYYFYLPLPQYVEKIRYDAKTQVFCFKFIHRNNFYKIFWNYLNKLFFSFSYFFFKKLKFKGKGYYIFKNFRNTIALQFGYSHKIYIYSYFIFVKFISKTVVVLFGINFFDIFKKSFEFFHTRTYNIFTSKGVRFAKQIIYKKTGKISSYR